MFLLDQRMVVTMMTMMLLKLDIWRSPATLGDVVFPLHQGLPVLLLLLHHWQCRWVQLQPFKIHLKSFTIFYSSLPANKCTLVFIISHCKESQCVENHSINTEKKLQGKYQPYLPQPILAHLKRPRGPPPTPHLPIF